MISILNQTTVSCCLHMGGALQLQHLISTLKLQLRTHLDLAIGHKHQGILIHGSTKLSLKFLIFLQSLPKGSVQKVVSYHTYHILTGLPKCNYSHHCLQSVNAAMPFVFYRKSARPKFLLLLPPKKRLHLLPLEKISWLSSVNKLQKIIAPGLYRHCQVSITCQPGCSQESGKSELADEDPGLLGVFFIR